MGKPKELKRVFKNRYHFLDPDKLEETLIEDLEHAIQNNQRWRAAVVKQPPTVMRSRNLAEYDGAIRALTKFLDQISDYKEWVRRKEDEDDDDKIS